MAPSVVLLGASSQIGLFAIPRLVAAGHSVVSISRSGRPPPDFPGFSTVRWARPEQVAEEARDARLMISAGPLSLAVTAMTELAALRRLIAFSTTSVYTKADSADRSERRQIDAIVAEESRLAALCRERDVTTCLLRPTLVYGAGMDHNVSFLADWAGKWPVLPLAGNATGLRQPVHADDLAQAAVAAMDFDGDLPAELLLAGGSTLSYRCMVKRIVDVVEPSTRVLPLPVGALVAAAALARCFGSRTIGPAMVRRQAEDLAFDDRAARELLGHAPRPFRPVPGDFCFPAAADLIAISKPARRADEEHNDVKI